MPSADHLKALIKSHAQGDHGRFYATALQLAATEARNGHGKLAQELRTLIDQHMAQSPVPSSPVGAVPISSPRGELSELLSISQPKVRLADIVLPDAVLGRIKRILSEQHYFAKIRSHGLQPRQKLLLVGPPGCGKTMTASVLAGELGVPLFVVRLEGLITKFMGETAAKLRLIFDAIENTRAVYLFDEFDSIGSRRGLPNDVGEMRRVLNSFLAFMDQHRSTSIVIAATNLPESLDEALFRRFDDIVRYELPPKALILKFLKARLSAYKARRIDVQRIAKTAAGVSFADLSKACDDAVKDMIISGRHFLCTDDLLRALSERLSLRRDPGTKGPQ